MPIYMNYDSLAIKGSVTEEGHKDWVELSSLNWGVGRRISTPTGAAVNREASTPSITEITVTKANDAGSVKILDEALRGKGKAVVIDFCKTSADKFEVYLTYTLTDCLISGYSFQGSGGQADGRPMETLTLNFTKLEFKNTPMKSTNEAGSPETVTYDLAAGKVV